MKFGGRRRRPRESSDAGSVLPCLFAYLVQGKKINKIKIKKKGKVIRVLKKSSHYLFGPIALGDLRRGPYIYIFSTNEITNEGKKKKGRNKGNNVI